MKKEEIKNRLSIEKKAILSEIAKYTKEKNRVIEIMKYIFNQATSQGNEYLESIEDVDSIEYTIKEAYQATMTDDEKSKANEEYCDYLVDIKKRAKNNFYL